MRNRGFIFMLLCFWYGIGSYTIQAQYLPGEWRISDRVTTPNLTPSFYITNKEVGANVCNPTFPGPKGSFYSMQVWWYQSITAVSYNTKNNQISSIKLAGDYTNNKFSPLDFSVFGKILDNNRIARIEVTLVKAAWWNSGFLCFDTRVVTKTFKDVIGLTNEYKIGSSILKPNKNTPVILVNGVNSPTPTVGINDSITLQAQYDFGDNDSRFYKWHYSLNGSIFKPLNKTGKNISGNIISIMNQTGLQPKEYTYGNIFFKLDPSVYYIDGGVQSIKYYPEPTLINIPSARVTCNGDYNGKVTIRLAEDLPMFDRIKYTIFKGDVAAGSGNIEWGRGLEFYYSKIDTPGLTAGDNYSIRYFQYTDDSKENGERKSIEKTIPFEVKQPDSVNFPRTIFADDYLLCAGTTGQTFIDTKEAWSSGNGAPYHFWMYKEGAIDTVKKDLANNSKYTFDGLMSGKYTYGGTDFEGCPASVNSFEMKEPAIPSYRIKTEDSLGEYKTGAARCYGLDDSVKNMYVYNPRATVAYYQMNTAQPDRAGEWWSTYYKHANPGNPNQDTFVNPVFNLYGKLRDTAIIQLREWHIDKASGFTFTCPVYKRDERDSLILKDSTRLIVDTVLFINEGVDIVGDTALKLKKDSAYFTIDTILYADSELYISAKKDTLYRDKDSVLYENDSLYIVKDTVFLNLYKTWTLSDSVFKVKDTLFINRTNLLYTGDSMYIYNDTVFLKRDSFITTKPNLYILEDTLLMKKDSLICVDAKVNISNDTGYISKDSILLIDRNVYINEDTVWQSIDSVMYKGLFVTGFRNGVDTGFVITHSVDSVIDSIFVGKYFVVLPKNIVLKKDIILPPESFVWRDTLLVKDTLLFKDSLILKDTILPVDRFFSADSIVYTGNSMYMEVGDSSSIKIYAGDTIYKIQDTGYLKQDKVFTINEKMLFVDSVLVSRKDSVLYFSADSLSLYMIADTLYKNKEDSVIYVDAKLYIVGDSLLLSQDSALFVDRKLLLRGDSAFVNRDSSLFVGRYLYNRGDSIYWERNEYLYVSNKLYMLNDSTVKDRDSVVLIKPNVYKKNDSIILDSNVYHYKGDSIYREVDSFVVLKKRIAYIEGDSVSIKSDSLYVKNDSVYVLKRDTVSYLEWKDTLQVWQPSPLVVSLTYLKDVVCYNDSNGRVEVQVKGGTTFKVNGEPNYWYTRHYSWNRYIDSITGFIDTLLTAKEHVFYIEDYNKCKTKDSLIVYQPTKLEIDSVISIQPQCFDARTGEIAIYPRGGAVRHPLQYSIVWSPLDEREVEEKKIMQDTLSEYRIKNIRSRASERQVIGVDYTATVSDTNACKIQGKMRIVNPATLRITDKEITSACTGESNGTAVYTFGNTRGVVHIDFTDFPAKSVLGVTKIKGLTEGAYPVVIGDGSGVCAIYDTIRIPSLSTQSKSIDKERYLCLGQSVVYDIAQPGENLGYEWRSDKGFYSIEPKVILNKGDRYYATTTQYGVPTCSRTDTLNLIDYATQIGNEIALDPRGNLRAWTVAVNTSYPPVDSIRWVLPESAEAEVGNINRQYLYFKDTGIYTVGMYTYRGPCWAYSERSIRVMNMSDMDPRDVPIDRKGIADFLTFPNPNPGGQFTIWVDLFDIDDVEVWLATNPMARIAQGRGQQYYRFNINYPLSTGSYTLIVKTRHGERTFNIIVW